MNCYHSNILRLQDKLRGMGKTVNIPMSDFIKEHRRLIPLLKKGTQAEREKEAKDQSAELKKMTGGAAEDDNEDVYDALATLIGYHIDYYIENGKTQTQADEIIDNDLAAHGFNYDSNRKTELLKIGKYLWSILPQSKKPLVDPVFLTPDRDLSDQEEDGKYLWGDF